MPRHKLNFDLHYGHAIEMMHARFWARSDRLLTFFQIVLGSAVFADVGNNMLFGGLLVVLSTLSFVWQPAMTALRFAKRGENYARLIINESTMTDDELRAALSKAAEDMPSELGVLTNPAHMRACIELGCPPTTKLTFWETVAAFIAGDVPKA
ncbi:hypothetical protein [Aeromonas caviae]|nr:hypothetical protein [Aeromonas caviae]